MGRVIAILMDGPLAGTHWSVLEDQQVITQIGALADAPDEHGIQDGYVRDRPLSLEELQETYPLRHNKGDSPQTLEERLEQEFPGHGVGDAYYFRYVEEVPTSGQ